MCVCACMRMCVCVCTCICMSTLGCLHAFTCTYLSMHIRNTKYLSSSHLMYSSAHNKVSVPFR